MGAMRPRTASYVRSSENYTHMGTLPRLLMSRRSKTNKGKGTSQERATERNSLKGKSLLSSPAGCSKKSKEKSSIHRSQSQRDKPASASVPGPEPRPKPDTELSQDPAADPKSQPEPAPEPGATNTICGPADGCEDVSPPGGATAAPQPEAGVDPNPDGASAPPHGRENRQTHGDGGLHSGPASAPREEADGGDLTEEADKGATKCVSR